MAAGGNPSNVDLGPGRLYVAPLGTAEPTTCSAALPSAWWSVGYTEEGTSVSTDITAEDIEVAEELDPIGYEQTKRASTVAFAMAETTKKRLALALGTGAAQTDDSSVFEFPDAGDIVGVMFVWDSEETPSVTNRRWLFRKNLPAGTVEIARRKAPQKALISASFRCVKPDSSTKAIRVFPNASGQI